LSTLRHFDADMDPVNRSVTCSLWGLAERTALFRPGLGCTLAIGFGPKSSCPPFPIHPPGIVRCGRRGTTYRPWISLLLYNQRNCSGSWTRPFQSRTRIVCDGPGRLWYCTGVASLPSDMPEDSQGILPFRAGL
jgi:hypothetical protein